MAPKKPTPEELNAAWGDVLCELSLLSARIEALAMYRAEFSHASLALQAIVAAAYDTAKQGPGLAELGKMSKSVVKSVHGRMSDETRSKLVQAVLDPAPARRVLARVAGLSAGRRPIAEVADSALETTTQMLADKASPEQIANAVFAAFWVLAAGSLDHMADGAAAMQASRTAVESLQMGKKAADAKAIVRAVFKACGYRKPLFKKLDQRENDARKRKKSQKRRV
jgi:hypothetical protein